MKVNVYIAKHDKIYYRHPEKEIDELFITIHQTKNCTVSVEQQALLIADLLNNAPIIG